VTISRNKKKTQFSLDCSKSPKFFFRYHVKDVMWNIGVRLCICMQTWKRFLSGFHVMSSATKI